MHPRRDYWHGYICDVGFVVGCGRRRRSAVASPLFARISKRCTNVARHAKNGEPQRSEPSCYCASCIDGTAGPWRASCGVFGHADSD